MRSSRVALFLFLSFSASLLGGELRENVACGSDPSQTYTLYVPTGYPGERQWPVLLIFDPRGRGTFAAEIFTEAAEQHGWVLMSSNNTRSDASWEPNQKALAAMWPEAHTRVRSDPARIYAAGFSGGAVVALSLAQTTHQIAGIISAGGRRESTIPMDRITFAHFGATGLNDFNYAEMHELDALLERKGATHRLEIFPGGHQWLPKETAAEAVEWFELLAMKSGLRPRDKSFIEEAWSRSMRKAAELERRGEKPVALQACAAAAVTFEKLRDVSEAAACAARLREDRETQRQQRAERQAREWESSQVRLPVSKISVPDLKRRARSGGPEGAAAQRVLESLFVQTSFYLVRDLFASKRYRDAAAVLEIAVSIKDDPRAWYNLGAARARLGLRGKALDALEQAVRFGWTDRTTLLADPDYESVRSERRFAELLDRIP